MFPGRNGEATARVVLPLCMQAHRPRFQQEHGLASPVHACWEGKCRLSLHPGKPDVQNGALIALIHNLVCVKIGDLPKGGQSPPKNCRCYEGMTPSHPSGGFLQGDPETVHLISHALATGIVALYGGTHGHRDKGVT